jgi:sodium-dependent dicarboxylate transporter 2/3/5
LIRLGSDNGHLCRFHLMNFQVLITRISAFFGLAFFCYTLFSSPPAGLSEAGWHTLGVSILMALLWISEAIPFAATALLPVVLFPFAGICNVTVASAPYANPVIFLFLGGIFIANGLQQSCLHKRIALKIICLAGTRQSALIAGFLVASAFLSMWVSNTAVALMMLPIAISVIVLFRAQNDTSFTPALVLTVAYGSSIGGMSTLVGTAPNAILAGFMLENYGITIGFLGWMILALPPVLVLLGLAWLVLTKLAFRVKGHAVEDAGDLLRVETGSLGPMSVGELGVMVVFFATAGLWLARGFLQFWVPWLTDATISMAGGIALFFLPLDRAWSSSILDQEALKKIPFDVLLLIGGGLSLAAAIHANGLAAWIGSFAHQAASLPAPAVVCSILFIIICLAELTSNTATTSAFLPVGAALAAGLNLPPLPLLAGIALASSCGFMLPVSTPPNAIVFSSGYVSMSQMIRSGILLNVASWIIFSFWLGWVIPRFSGWAEW